MTLSTATNDNVSVGTWKGRSRAPAPTTVVAMEGNPRVIKILAVLSHCIGSTSDRIKLCNLAAQEFSPDGFVLTSMGEAHPETFMDSLFPIHPFLVFVASLIFGTSKNTS
jgi:hypothetical protein